MVGDTSAETVYVLDGSPIDSLEGFYAAIGEAVNGPGGHFGSNLDALDECLDGGFGTPDGPLRFVLVNANRSSLGYAETVRQLEKRLAECHPSNRPFVERDLARARQKEGPTVLDWLIEIFGRHENVTLELRG